MATQRYGFNTTYIDGATEYTGPEIARLHRITDTQLGGAIEVFGTGVIKDPDDDSLLVEAVSGLDIKINPGRGFSRHSTYGGFWFQLTSTLNITGLAPNSTHYILAGLLTGEDDGETIDTRETGTPSILVSSTDTVDGALLLAEVVTGPSSVLSVTDLRNFVTLGDGPAVPTGTGFVHISSGVQDAAAKLVSNADVANDAAIAESKLNLASDASAGTPSRRSLGTGAQQAAAGNHGHSNATTSTAGFMSGTDKTKLDAATASPTASTLIARDTNGRAQIAAPSSDNDIATKKYVDDATAAGAPDADETTKGIVMLSVEPDGDPIAVGDNDPRLQDFGASGTEHSSGLVPTPGATPGSSKFLREDSTWAEPPQGSLTVQQDGEAAVNDVDTIVYDGATVTDNEDGSVNVEITPASVGAAEAVHTHDISDVTGLQTALDGKASTSHTHALGDLSNVTLSTPSNGQVLKYNGSAWVNAAESGGGAGIEGHEIQLNGTPFTQRGALNFTGDGVSISDDADNEVTVVTIAGGGSASLTPNQFKTLNFNAAPAVMEFGIEIGAGTDPVILTGGMDAEQIKAAIEASDDMDGYTVKVAGRTITTEGDDGVDLHTGVFIVAFEGDGPFPEWGEVKNSEVQTFAVEDGDGGAYSLNGGDNFTLGSSADSVQDTQRGLGGDYTNVVVKGSTNLSILGYNVSGAGTSAFNGDYFRYSEDFDGQYKTAGDTHYLYHIFETTWMLSTEPDHSLGPGSPVRYKVDSLATDPPLTGWEAVQGGAEPAPTLSEIILANALLYSYFPYSVGNVANPSATGTDANVNTLYEGGSTSTIVTATDSTLSELLISGLLNPQTSTDTESYVPANAGHWNTPPTTITEALDMLAASFNGAWGPV